jgi:hypothetical protein
MNISYDKLVLPDNLRPYVRELVPVTWDRDIPPGWDGLVIYHPATNQYYSTKSINPVQYYELLKTQYPDSVWKSVAVPLKLMLSSHPDFQMFVLHRRSREVVEKWFADNGKIRVTTKMGQAAEAQHVMFKVFSPYNKFTRYVTAPVDTPKEKLIEQANKSMGKWLGSNSKLHNNERTTMRVALRSLFQPNMEVFEPESVVTSTNYLSQAHHGQFRRISQNKNMEAIREFIRNTTRG